MAKKIWKLSQTKRLKKQISLNKYWKQKIKESRNRIQDILLWKSDRKLLIIWPCSVDFEESIFEYASFIKELKEKYSDKLEIVMRFYTGKPRTTVWWKGLSYSNPWEEVNIRKQINKCRNIAIRLIQDYDMSLADELLYPELSSKFWDLYSYMAVWARSSENQLHREVSSWLWFPIWLKNPTSWDLNIAVNSLKASLLPHEYILERNIYKTSGNPYSHIILRGWNIWPNYKEEDLKKTSELMDKSVIKDKSIIIDCNHDNSKKDHLKQIEILKEVMNQKNEIIKGFMIESYLHDWKQNFEKWCKKWLSLTDPCIWKENTKKLIEILHNNI